MYVVLVSPYSQIESTGVRILSACLKEAGFETRLVFLPDTREMLVETDYAVRFLSPLALRQIVDLSAGAAFVGISVMTSSFFLARQLTQALRAATDVPVLWGGVHPTVRPQECLQYADMVCVGEGERAIVELARRMAARRDYGDVNNLARIDADGRLVMNPLYPLEEDLDALPFPDYAYEQHFVLHQGQLVPCSRDLMYYYLSDIGSWASGPVYGVLTARGCPYRCTYCVNNAMAALYPKWCSLRQRSGENVVAEIQVARSRLPAIKAVVIRDDTFLANSESSIAEFSERYRQEVGLPFRVNTTAHTADPAKLRHLAGAGLRFVIMGIQSGSPRIQKLYGRAITNEQVLRAARTISELRAWAPRPMYDLITDNPYETKKDRFATLQLIHQLPQPYRLALYSLTFYPGTALYDQALADGLIEDGPGSSYSRNFQMFQSNYYTFALVCHHFGLPRAILYLLTRRVVFDWMSWPPLDRLSGWLLDRVLGLRLCRNKRLYVQRQRQWLSRQEADWHA